MGWIGGELTHHRAHCRAGPAAAEKGAAADPGLGGFDDWTEPGHAIRPEIGLAVQAMASRGVMSDVAQRNCSTWNNCVGGYRCWWGFAKNFCDSCRRTIAQLQGHRGGAISAKITIDSFRGSG